MMKKILTILFKALLVLSLTGTGAALAASKSDLAKEKRWEEQVVPSLFVGEDIKLTAGGVNFLGLYTEAGTDKRKGAVILVHGRGAHPAWPDVIEPLRMQLPDMGWDTLSIQMPVLENEAEDKDYVPLMPEVPARIQAAVDYLKNLGVKKIIIAGHSTGASMASYYLATHHDPDVKGFAIISGGEGVPNDERMDSVKNFQKINGIAVIDIRGGEDQERIRELVNQRQEISSKHRSNRYETLVIPGAGHFYRGHESELVADLDDWLQRRF